MAAIDNAVKVNSQCFFAYELKDQMGDGTGLYRLVEQPIQSRTFLPEGTVVFSHKDWKEMVKEIKKEAKYIFKASALSESIKDKLKKEKLDDKIKDEKDIVDIDSKPKSKS